MRVRWLIIGLAALLISGCGLLDTVGIFPSDDSSTSAPEMGTAVLLAAPIPLDNATFEQARSVLTARLDQLNIAGEVNAAPAMNRCLLLTIPSVDDLENNLTALTSVGLLEFVDLSGMEFAILDQYTGEPILTTEQVARGLEPTVGTLDPLTRDGAPFETALTGEIITSAVAVETDFGWQIDFEISQDNQTDFGNYTASNIGQPLGIVVDGLLITAPTIRSALFFGGVITGDFSEAEAQSLAAQLLSGALPVPLAVLAINTGDALDTTGCE